MFYSKKKDVSFYYIYWNDGVARIDWLTLVFSICTVRYIYPDSQITVINYTPPDEQLCYFSEILNFRLIYEEKPFYGYLNPDNNIVNIVSKPIDAFNLAKRDNTTLAFLLDADVFLVNKFTITKPNLVNLLLYPSGSCNSGLVSMNVNHPSASHMFQMYQNFVDLCQSTIKDARERLVTLGYGYYRKLSEEMIFNIILKKMPEWNSVVFENIGENNHFIFRKENKLERFNAIHAMYIEKNNIATAIAKTNYMQELIKELIPENKYLKFIQERIDKPVHDREELDFISAIDSARNIVKSS